MTATTANAMLARQNIRQWLASKHDKRVSAEVAERHGSDIDMGRFQKNLVTRESLKRIQSAITALRNHHYENTLPWMDDGLRLLPASSYFAYVERQRQLKDEFNEAVMDFAASYGEYVEEAKRRLNGLFDQADYPLPSEIVGRFSVDVSVAPIPEGGDFRISLGAEEEAKIREDIERRNQEALKEATDDLWKRVHTIVTNTVERLKSYKIDPETGKTLSTFRDSLVERMRDFVDLLGRLNITGDPELENMRQRLSNSLCQDDAETLRSDPVLRAAAIRSAEEILADMAGYCA